MHSFSLGTLLLKLQLSEDRPFSLGLCRQVENLQDQALQRSLPWAGTCRRRRPSLPRVCGNWPCHLPDLPGPGGASLPSCGFRTWGRCAVSCWPAEALDSMVA